MMKFYLTILTFTFLSVVGATAAPRTKAQMQKAAKTAISQHRTARHLAPRNDEPRELRKTATYSIMGYEEGGFAVVSADDLVPEVLGVSASSYSEGRNQNFEWWLRTMETVASYAMAHNAPLKTTLPDPNKYPTEVLPMVTTEWDQETPYNNMCPTFSGSTKCLTGCVATAMAQVMAYHKSPQHGEGQRTIYYPHGNTYSGQPVTADFEGDYYDWENMLDDYSNGYNQTQADAVALLMRDCGVAADMMYGGPDEGSGAYSQDAAEGMRKYFGFEEAQCLERDQYTESAWMDIVYRELSENGPLYYGGADAWMGGHAFVVHGYRADGKVYVNWGWSGEDDGYYDISLLNPAYYTFSYGQDMIIGVKSTTHSQLRTETVDVKAAGSLQQTVEALEGEGDIGSLTVSGQLNDNDLLYLRYLAGRDADGYETSGMLRSMDLSKAEFPDNTLSAEMFKNCTSLRRVRLPESIKAIGDEAFKGCTRIYELRVPSKQVPTLGSSVFSGMSFGTVKLYVRSGMRSKYQQIAQWKDFGTNNIVEFGTSIKVRNTIRKYGDENPNFFYYVNGGTIVGEPELTCEATPESPAGRYPIEIGLGTIETEDEIDFIDGYLIVQRVDATATVVNVSRPMGEENPEFTLTYEGLKNNEEQPVWLAEPVFECEADEESPEGEYPITVKDAVAQSYNMTFVAGTLTVTAPMPSSLHLLPSTFHHPLDLWSLARQEPSTTYNLQGQRVGKNYKGITVSDGKKKVIRK